MTRDRASLACVLVSLLAVTASALGQIPSRPGVIGTPPPEGHTIQEVATISVTEEVQLALEYEQQHYSFDVELPLPVFPSSGLPAEPAECLWTLLQTNWETYFGLLLGGMSYVSYTLEGRTLTVELDVRPVTQPDVLLLDYELTGVAIRTAPPAPVESMSFGEIKAMFREE